MIDLDTFLTTLYVMVDDFASLVFPSRSILQDRWPPCNVVRSSRWRCLDNGYSLRANGPFTATRSTICKQHAITIFGLYLVQLMQAQACLYEVLDSTAAVTRDAKRRGAGWLAGQADIGWSNRIGWQASFGLCWLA